MKKVSVRVADTEYKLWCPDDMTDEIRDQVGEIFHSECYKEGKIKKDAVYIDIGANVGNSAFYFKDWAKKIYALEPNPHIFKCLEKNMKNHKNVECFNIGIAPYTGEDHLFSGKGEGAAQTLFSTEETSTYSVPAKFMALDEFMEEQGIEHVDVLKIDAEGAEFVIFPSVSFESAAKKIDHIIGETHYGCKGGFPDIIPVILDDYGFDTIAPEPKHKGWKNYYRKFGYRDRSHNIVKKYEVGYNTIFFATKRK